MLESASRGRWARLMVTTCTLIMPVAAIGGDGRLARKRLYFTMTAGDDAGMAIGREVESAASQAVLWHREHPAWGPLNVVVPVGSMPAHRSEALQNTAVVDDWDVCDGFGHLMAKAQHLAAGHLSELIMKGKVVMEAAASLSASFDDEAGEEDPLVLPPNVIPWSPSRRNHGRDWWHPQG
ncbi:hypothetical protein LB518_23125 [Mesorhizobium sp. BR1-1-16]|uniref:hypothetical protein n=1 Tax=Mesorhizobium sp. BR1-1-16 TaxID=2876653 RepID=UPI001CCA0305|nr:hypothetical protein [Mesorhizobium sp. BR1-1-16]MBZ9939208.1 hypothetical protein [Mesorhizobium sp. BR1-1-16]